VLVDYFQPVSPIIGGDGICAGFRIQSYLHPFAETEIEFRMVPGRFYLELDPVSKFSIAYSIKVDQNVSSSRT
jgi:hypothetical protein